MKTAVLFSGGKDSFYSLQVANQSQGVDLVVALESNSGSTQLHAGPESEEKLMRAMLDLLPLPHTKLMISSDKDYLNDLFTKLDQLVKKEQITHLVTGDLWHPYTSGISDMLAGALGAEIVRPAKDVCFNIGQSMGYMIELLGSEIEPIILSVRKDDLPEKFVGRKIDVVLLKELEEMGVDVAAEGGEYQSFVTSSPLLEKNIVIDDFSIELVDGKNKKEQFYRMKDVEFHTI